MDDSIAIHEIKLVQIDGRMLLSMPNRRCADGVYRDIVHPISIEAREILQEAIVKAYKDWVAKQ
jgi:stage V sporulation protein G